jgi:hypothetical protein
LAGVDKTNVTPEGAYAAGWKLLVLFMGVMISFINLSRLDGAVPRTFF